MLPLLYVDYPPHQEQDPQDDAVALVKQFQWDNWTSLRHAERPSRAYRERAALLAQRLVKANAVAEQAPVDEPQRTAEFAQEQAAEEPGMLDSLGAMEDAYKGVAASSVSISGEMDGVLGILERSSTRLKSSSLRNQGFAALLGEARQVAEELAGPADTLLTLANQYVSQLHEADKGVPVYLELVATHLIVNPKDKKRWCESVRKLAELCTINRELSENLQPSLELLPTLEGMSRDLRPPVRQLRQALTLMAEARRVTDEWERLIKNLHVDCRQA